MKTYRNLYPQLWDWENLYLAYRKARKGKRSRPSAAGFEFNLESNLIGLQQALRDKSYTPGQYSSFLLVPTLGVGMPMGRSAPARIDNKPQLDDLAGALH